MSSDQNWRTQHSGSCSCWRHQMNVHQNEQISSVLQEPATPKSHIIILVHMDQLHPEHTKTQKYRFKQDINTYYSCSEITMALLNKLVQPVSGPIEGFNWTLWLEPNKNNYLLHPDKPFNSTASGFRCRTLNGRVGTRIGTGLVFQLKLSIHHSWRDKLHHELRDCTRKGRQ